MKVLFIGDIVGDIGLDAVEKYLPKLKRKYAIDVVIANAENAAKGRGLTRRIYQDLLMMGVDAMTMGNHTWDQREIFDFIDDADYLVRPANFSEDAPGKGMTTVTKNGQTISIINLHGRVFLPPHEDPFKMGKELVAEAKKVSPLVFVDFHAETTSEKIALGWHLVGEASCVVGTHTHVQTADSRILPGGTAYISDVGMTGPYNEVLGMKKESVLYRFQTNLPVRFEVPTKGDAVLSAVFVELDDKTGQAKQMERIYINPDNPFKG